MRTSKELLELREEVRQLKALIEHLRLELAMRPQTIVVNPAPVTIPTTPYAPDWTYRPYTHTTWCGPTEYQQHVCGDFQNLGFVAQAISGQ